MTDPDIHDAKAALDQLSLDPKARQLAEDRALWEYVQRREREFQFNEGLVEGERRGLVEAVHALCQVFDVELTDERQLVLEGASSDELKALVQELKSQRRWPE